MTNPAESQPRRWRLSLWRRFQILVIGVIVALYAVLLMLILDPFEFDQSDQQESPANTSPQRTPPAISGAWPADVQFIEHTVPAIIKDDLLFPRENRGYVFYGDAGQTWILTVEPQDASMVDPLFFVYGPSGAEIAISDDRAAGDFSAQAIITLPETGYYRVMVRSSQGGVTTGDYLLTLWPQ